MKKIDDLSIDDFIVYLNNRYKLGLSDKKIKNSIAVLKEQWFGKAVDMQDIDEAMFEFLDIEEEISQAVLKLYGGHKDNTVHDDVFIPIVVPKIVKDDVKQPETTDTKDTKDTKVVKGGCGICGKDGDVYSLRCKHGFCKPCLHDYIMKNVQKKTVAGMTCPSTEECKVELDPSDIQSTLSPKEFNEYLEATFAAFIQADNSTFGCPNDKCKNIISVGDFKKPKKLGKITEKDDEGKVLTKEAYLHFKEFRYRCRSCNINFCADCKISPYHKGHTCVEWQEYLKARHCRFCETKLKSNNTIKNAPSITLQDCCTEEECVEKMKICCTKRLKCGCPCNGVRDEKTCLPCLEHELKIADDYCTICYVEALKSCPAIQMQGDCKHVFHAECVKRKIEARWPYARIGFSFLGCPTCKKDLYHEALDHVFKPVQDLYADIKKKSLQRLKYENRMKCKEITDKNSEYYNKPLKFALKSYLFYSCYQCKKPYFAGGYQCEEANADFDEKELICPSCQPQSCDDCPTHGKEWLAFKCRYCCSVANWFCWGKTHFCDACHKSGVWQTLAVFRTGENKKKYQDYKQCKGFLQPIKDVLKKKKGDAAQQKSIEALRSEIASCPLKMQHPPNGMEFGLGCSMCADKKAEEKNVEVAEKAKEEEKEERDKLMSFKKDIPKTGKKFKHVSDLDKNGVFWWLATLGLKKSWVNPVDRGILKVKASSLMGDSAPAKSIFGRKVVRCVTKPRNKSYFQIDFIDMSFKIDSYMLRHYNSWDTEALRNWQLEGSNDGENWNVLKRHTGDDHLNKKGGTHTWNINSNRSFRYFKILQFGKNSNSNFYLALTSMELWGTLYPEVRDDVVEEKVGAKVQNPQGKNLQSRVFKYVKDFDEHGILYNLGTNFGKNKWSNPGQNGSVVASCSALASNPASTPAHAICGRKLVRCVSAAKPFSWFMIDFLDKAVQPTHYTLKHYSTWETEALRKWNLEASDDGRRWIQIKKHNNDKSLYGKGATFTWRISCNKPYRYWRILQTGRNSNNHHYLACSGIEFAGNLVSANANAMNVEVKEAKDVEVALNYAYNFDDGDVFDWIGKNFGKSQWVNPGMSGKVFIQSTPLVKQPASLPAYSLLGKKVIRCVTIPSKNAFFQFDLKNVRIQVKKFGLRHYSSWDTECITTFQIQGSKDGITWTILSDHVNDKHIRKKGATHVWTCTRPSNEFWRYVRIYQTGKNSNNHGYLALSAFRVWGKARLVGGNGNVKAGADQPNWMKGGFGKNFKYSYDFDQNGIIYWLGTRGKTQKFENPANSGQVICSSSPLARNPASEPISRACERKLLRIVTQPKKSGFMGIDFVDKYICLNKYTLRHYSSWDVECLRNWNLEGSNNGRDWTTLKVHSNDQSLNKKGQSKSWDVESNGRKFRRFRIRQTGINSNNHYYLALSGYEWYGSMHKQP